MALPGYIQLSFLIQNTNHTEQTKSLTHNILSYHIKLVNYVQKYSELS